MSSPGTLRSAYRTPRSIPYSVGLNCTRIGRASSEPGAAETFVSLAFVSLTSRPAPRSRSPMSKPHGPGERTRRPGEHAGTHAIDPLVRELHRLDGDLVRLRVEAGALQLLDVGVLEVPDADRDVRRERHERERGQRRGG